MDSRSYFVAIVGDWTDAVANDKDKPPKDKPPKDKPPKDKPPKGDQYMALSAACKNVLTVMFANKAASDRIAAIIDAGSGTVAGTDRELVRVALGAPGAGKNLLAVIDAGTGTLSDRDQKSLKIAMCNVGLADELIAAIA